MSRGRWQRSDVRISLREFAGEEFFPLAATGEETDQEASQLPRAVTIRIASTESRKSADVPGPSGAGFGRHPNERRESFAPHRALGISGGVWRKPAYS